MGAGGQVGPPHPSWVRPHPRPRPSGVWAPGASPQVVFGLRKLPDVICSEEKISPDFDDILRVDISETKNSRKHGTGTLASC
mgnify:CR=1 FL=1